MKSCILPYKRADQYALIILVLLCFLILPQQLLAQKHDNIWYFGSGAGISFSSGTAVPLNNGQLVTSEGSACISDEFTGELLFYTDGSTIWNRMGVPMETGLL